MIIGLTGGLASGKTTISDLLEKEGYPIIDADKITHQLYETSKEAYAVIEKIAPQVLVQHKINRALLAQSISAQPQLLPILEKGIHPLIEKEIQKQIKLKTAHFKVIILVAPLLFETQLNQLCDSVICLFAPVAVQKKRALERPLMTLAQFNALIERQWTNEQRQEKADLWVSATDSIEQTYTTVFHFLQNIK